MEFLKILNSHSASKLQRAQNDDSFVDRLNHRYTPTICILSALIVSTKQYVGDPIDCWCPAQFTSSYDRYTDSYCWMKNTYIVPTNEDITVDTHTRKATEIRYYQWVPLILSLQACLFYFPKITWRTCASRFGLSVFKLVNAAQRYQSTTENNDDLERQKQLSFICDSFHRAVSVDRAFDDLSKLRNRRFDRLRSCRPPLIVVYALVKLLWIGNCLFQLLAMNAIFGSSYHLYGLQILTRLIIFKKPLPSVQQYFPKIAFCDFTIREVGFTHHYTVQCVLKVNLFNEIIFTFLWFWVAVMFLLSSIDLLNIFHMALDVKMRQYVCDRLELVLIMNRKNPMRKNRSNMRGHKGMDLSARGNSPPNSVVHCRPRCGTHSVPDQHSFDLFLRSTFNLDVVFCLRMIEQNVGSATVLDIMQSLWMNFESDRDLGIHVATDDCPASEHLTYSAINTDHRHSPFPTETREGCAERQSTICRHNHKLYDITNSTV